MRIRKVRGNNILDIRCQVGDRFRPCLVTRLGGGRFGTVPPEHCSTFFWVIIVQILIN
jgi:hypothetical protein